MLQKILFIACIISCYFVDSARILCIFPVPFYSHQSVFRVLTEALANQGHNLVVLTPLPRDRPIENIKEIDVKNISNQIWNEGAKQMVIMNQNEIKINPLTFWTVACETVIEILDAQLGCEEMKNIIQDENEHFDLILLEGVTRAPLIVTGRFKSPVIMVSSFYGCQEIYNIIGAPIHPLLYSDYNNVNVANPTIVDKIRSLYTYVMVKYIDWKLQEKENNVIRKHFGVNSPSVTELKKYVQMLFLNAHQLWDNNRPVPPSVLYMGALHMIPTKPLPSDLETYLNNSKHGVIYMSLGSKFLSNNLPQEILQIFLEVFSTLPYEVMWKWNAGEFPDKPKNIRIGEWFPQNDILKHPKIKAFITQGGLQSADEAIATNVPLIAFPLFADQFYNAEMFIRYGIGLKLDIDAFTTDDLRDAINEVIQNKSYVNNLRHLSKIMEEQRAGGLQKAIHWIEYTAANGVPHLRSPLADISAVDYYLLDVIALICVGVFLIVGILTISIKFLFNIVSYNNKIKIN